jgi:hypothetical protein
MYAPHTHHRAVPDEGLRGSDDVIIHKERVLKCLAHFEVGGRRMQEHATVCTCVKLGEQREWGAVRAK